jgi:hypothetical protein
MWFPEGLENTPLDFFLQATTFKIINQTAGFLD